MKTILHILIILVVASLVGGGIYAIVENTSLVSSSDTAPGELPAMTNTDETANAPLDFPDGGDHHDASLSRGFSEVLVMVGKLAGITLLVLVVQKGLSLVRKFTTRLSPA